MARDKKIVSATYPILWPGTLVEGNKTINSYLLSVYPVSAGVENVVVRFSGGQTPKGLF